MPIDIKALTVMVLITGLSTLFGFYFITKGIKLIGATEVAFINLLEPIIAVVGGIVLFHDKIDLLGVIGAILVLLSIILVSLKDNIDR